MESLRLKNQVTSEKKHHIAICHMNAKDNKAIFLEFWGEMMVTQNSVSYQNISDKQLLKSKPFMYNPN